MLRSFVTSCQRVHVDPFAWFKDILTRIPSHSINRIAELLPHNWASAQTCKYARQRHHSLQLISVWLTTASVSRPSFRMTSPQVTMVIAVCVRENCHVPKFSSPTVSMVRVSSR